MIELIVFFGNFFLIFFSIMVAIIEILLLLFRNSISFNIQHNIRRSIPFFSLLIASITTVLRSTTNIVYTTVDVPLVKIISSNNVKTSIYANKLFQNLYLFITAILILQYATRYFLCIFKIKKSTDITNRFNNALDKRNIKVYSWKNAKTPFCFGTLSKCIVFPENYTNGINYAIKHEISHCDNYDSFTNNIAMIILLLMWFNPLAYLHYQQIKTGCEYACDERVTKNLSFPEKKDYIEVILASTQRKQFVFAGAALATENKLKSRFINILSNRINNNKKSVIVCFTVVLVLTTAITFIAVIKIPEQRIKSVKINYSCEQEVNNEVYYEEYIDGKWFRGDLHFDSVNDLDYGIKNVKYVGILYENE